MRGLVALSLPYRQHPARLEFDRSVDSPNGGVPGNLPGAPRVAGLARIASMFVQFDSRVGRFTMLGHHAEQLLRLMGHSGTIPSAILAEDIPPALERLKTAVATGGAPPTKAESEEDGGDQEPPVSLSQRAFPLIDLLERAAREGCDVTWEKR